ncbi:MAG TPA: TonB-dependent receptor [Pedobacter sp.]|uniref:TonB-dependent receptor n=1 Tax=Pedobacter sp. TaxID=1411316 RepID=UPI002B886B31|nr:TonB-dependent receptor [Pedobacter sp.]HMI01287.1 TonB-dependent receptor [Pedobacter sp.]
MKSLLTATLILLAMTGSAQTRQDSTKRLNEVVIRPYFSSQPLLRSTGSIGLADQSVIDRQPSGSLVNAVNTISGVRMEERSPGSYRLSIRGSLLRSPFGVRNVKIYFDDFPLTDAGGNSYLNALDVAGAGSLQVLKGPHGSIFGANSGGVILIQPQLAPADSTLATLKVEGGSFGTFHQNATLNQQFKKYTINITQAYQRSDGYRDHSDMDRKYFQVFQKYDYAKNASLKALLFYSDLRYNTPGGLTAAQFLADPKVSRPATPATKSAIEQNAGIYSKTIYGGVSNDWIINAHFKHVVSVFSTYTDFKNPFITNYEERKEFTLGLRSYVEYASQAQNINWKLNAGLESMRTSTNYDNFDNNSGTPGNIKEADDLRASGSFAFVHFNFDLFNKLLIETSASANLYEYTYKSISPVAIPKRTKTFHVQLMPRLALSYLIDPRFSIRASVSRGYSPPSLGEVRGSNNVVNTSLQPEYGWNYETGIRFQTEDGRLLLDMDGYYYKLKQAIVRRVDQDEKDYFVNAGGTKQWGLETSLSYWVLPARTTGIIRGLQLRNAYTLSRFKFEEYLNNTDNFSGNALTGVPKAVVVSSADVLLPEDFYVFLQHNYTSSIPLNDANTVYARKYHLIQTKAGWKNLRIGKTPVELFAGADNLLNQKYSLGNDLNAVGNRYFNAAATRNFYAGLALRFNKKH